MSNSSIGERGSRSRRRGAGGCRTPAVAPSANAERAAMRCTKVVCGFAHVTPPIGRSPDHCASSADAEPVISASFHAAGRPDRIRSARIGVAPVTSCRTEPRDRWRRRSRPRITATCGDVDSITTIRSARFRARGWPDSDGSLVAVVGGSCGRVGGRRSKRRSGVDRRDRWLGTVGHRCARVGDRVGVVADGRPTRRARSQWWRPWQPASAARPQSNSLLLGGPGGRSADGGGDDGRVRTPVGDASPTATRTDSHCDSPLVPDSPPS